jgi:hypothetical protein
VNARRIILFVAFATTAALALGSAALAAPPAQRLALHGLQLPSSFSAADNARCEAEGLKFCDDFQITATDVGDHATAGAITLTDTLPAGLKAREVEFIKNILGGNVEIISPECKIEAQTVKCRHTAALQPDQSLELRLAVLVEPGAIGGEVNSITVSGGGSAGASLSEPVALGSPPPPFGIKELSTSLFGADGEPDLRAGGHPYEYRTRFDLDTAFVLTPESSLQANSVEDLRDAVVDLPPGLVGSAQAAPKCTFTALESFAGCPPETRVGNIVTDPEAIARVNSGLFNMIPEHGVAAEFGYTDALHNVHVIYSSVVPTPQGYVIRATAPETPQVALTDAVVVFFGDPAAKDGGEGETAFFTNPADCSGEALQTTMHTDSWQNPAGLEAGGSPDFADPAWAAASSQTPAVTECENLHFEPTVEAKLEDEATHAATETTDSPTAFDVNLQVPQPEGFAELATPPLKTALVTLPEGLVVNPSSANGLAGCSLAQVGISAAGEPDAAPPACPDASKIGTVELETPALPGVLQGQIYVARQAENPFHSLLAIYIIVDDPTTGVIVKLAGEVRPDQSTGRLTTVVAQSPQFPFSELRTHFFGGNRAALRTPSLCGTDTLTTELTPWSAPQSGPPATPSSSFQVSKAVGGGSCPTSPGAEPNHPAFTAGTLSAQAGAYSPLVVRGARADGDQPITQVNVTLPKGLTGKLAGIPYCPESDIALAKSREHEGGGAEELAHPACPAASEVGVVQVGAGAGPEPYYVTGHAYLTGPYKGAPLGVAIISPAVAGPFDLGDVVVRAALDVDPFTAQVSAVSDPIPTILDGIPLDIRSISLEMSRHEFTLNPTNCEKMSFTGEAVGQFGTTAALSDPFQVGGCNALAFKPRLQISLKGSTRHAGHPALKAVLTYPKQGAYANIARAQVNLPHSEFIDQGNLNKTCTRPVLLAGACPASTIYGKAKAWTPLLEAPLEGPVYLVGGFGYKLPALVAELGGQIRVLLAGKVDSGPNHGIRNTFEAVPDAPVERFVLEMKGGPKYSLLENSEDLCSKPQRAIAAFTAQNGATLKLRPKIANGCKKKGERKKGKHHKKGKGHGKKAGGKKGAKAGKGKHQRSAPHASRAALLRVLPSGW